MDTKSKTRRRSKKPTLISSWDDGSKLDLKLASYLQYYNIPAIFYLTNEYELTDDQVCFLADRFEIGGHSSHHFELSMIDKDLAKSEIENNKSFLEGIIGKPIHSFCYPRGRFNEQVKYLVKQAGYDSARTTKILDINPPADPYQWNTSIHISYPNRVEYEGRDMIEVAKELYDKTRKIGGEFHIWGHSHELERYGLWDKLEEILRYITKYTYYESPYSK